MSKITDTLSAIINQRRDDINQWFAEEYSQTDPFFYTSVDIRHSGNKIVPVDSNLFPAGANLLSPDGRERCTKEMREYFSKHIPGAKNILLIPEDFTRNLNYLDNISVLKELIEHCDMEVRIGGLIVENDPLELTSASGHKLKIEPINKKDNHVFLNNGHFVPDAILVNNVLSVEAPPIFQDIKQPVIPPIGLGWYRRRKIQHFDMYKEISSKFAKEFSIDPWLISAFYSKCGHIDFKDKKGLECVAVTTEKIIHNVKQKYDEYGIKEEPFVFVKANAGSFGLGIMVVRSGDEVFEINKRSRNKMNVIKEGVKNSEVIVQEGIPTIDSVDGHPAESLIYIVNGTPVDCTYRINENRDAFGNLNSPGMSFRSSCEGDKEKSGEMHYICPVHALIAKLSSLAATREKYDT